MLRSNLGIMLGGMGDRAGIMFGAWKLRRIYSRSEKCISRYCALFHRGMLANWRSFFRMASPAFAGHAHRESIRK
jgi:hypothetical protein